MAHNQKVALIIGGNSGIGFEVAKALYASRRAYHILLGGRSLEKAITATKVIEDQIKDTTSSIEAVQIDIEDDQSIKRVVTTIQSNHGCLDVLINNAGMPGVMSERDPDLGSADYTDSSHLGASFDRFVKSGEMTMREVWNKSWNVNVVGAQVLTEALVPLLLKGKDVRVVLVKRGTKKFKEKVTIPRVDAKPVAGWPKSDFLDARSYRCAKVGLNMMMREWHRFFSNDDVKVFCVSPGVLATGLAGIGRENMIKMGAGDASIGGKLIRDVVEGVRDNDEALVIKPQGVQPW
jgi:NAD(P)-dependent dehydrogenase (short-subunit alcohol dehydrogenase family)